jgi:hypothetical protein
MNSENVHGQSLPSYKLKVLTLTTKEAEAKKQNPSEKKNGKNVRVPTLPDIKECCINGNVAHQRYGLIPIFII